ncbi:MAG: FeoA family protein [Pseudobdellovibrionaceae bacterium]
MTAKTQSLDKVVLQTNQSLEISGFCGSENTVERLKELGFHQGLKIEFVGQAPWHGPRLFRFSNTVLALRDQEAACVLVLL